jgi:deoxyadenosine/deoxycytidine kinase
MALAAPFIVVAGNIAAGKSTLVHRLADELGVDAHPERVADNPFFGSPAARALESETWFLADAALTHRAIQRAGRGGVQERSVYEHVAVFARARARLGWLGAEELGLLQTLARLLGEDLLPPDLLVYVESDLPALQARIAARARPGEQEIDADYLALLGELYEELIEGWRHSPVCRLNSVQVDVRREEGFRVAWRAIDALLPHHL